MADGGGETGRAGDMRRSRLAEYAEMSVPKTPETLDTPEIPETPDTPPGPATVSRSSDGEAITRGRREFAVLLGLFRRTAVLVPLDADDTPLTADRDGIRWILAFSNESALARFAIARGEGDREWAYQRVLGARLLDACVPAVGVPCGVALDAASGDEGVLFPPVSGIVPDSEAVDVRDGESAE
ncbi:hypothetical protein ACWD5V_05110 [Streptomyces sp. NPDC002523]